MCGRSMAPAARLSRAQAGSRRPTAIAMSRRLSARAGASVGAPRVRFGVPPGSQVVAADPSGPRLLVRDFGERLCLGIDALALDGRDCEDPPVSSRFGFLEASPAAGGFLLWGFFAARVATLSVGFGDGRRLAIPLTDGPAYTGRYRGAVRFALFTLAADADLKAIDALDASGMRVGAPAPSASSAQTTDEAPRPTTVLAAGTACPSPRRRIRDRYAGARSGRAASRSPTAGERMDDVHGVPASGRPPPSRASPARAGRRSSTA